MTQEHVNMIPDKGRLGACLTSTWADGGSEKEKAVALPELKMSKRQKRKLKSELIRLLHARIKAREMCDKGLEDRLHEQELRVEAKLNQGGVILPTWQELGL